MASHSLRIHCRAWHSIGLRAARNNLVARHEPDKFACLLIGRRCIARFWHLSAVCPVGRTHEGARSPNWSHAVINEGKLSEYTLSNFLLPMKCCKLLYTTSAALLPHGSAYRKRVAKSRKVSMSVKPFTPLIPNPSPIETWSRVTISPNSIGSGLRSSGSLLGFENFFLFRDFPTTQPSHEGRAGL